MVEVYHLTHPHSLTQENTPPSAMALGFFDGVHLGHQKVINTAKQIANEQNIQSAVMTFDPHPAVVLGKKKNPEYLTPLKEKEHQIQALGIDRLYVVEFDETFSRLTPRQFVDAYIVRLNVRHTVCGFDFTYGHKGKGTSETLFDDADGRFGVTIVDKVEKNGEKISSTKIRELLHTGKADEVTAFLGHPYEMTGTVVEGEKRGRTIGFPTANIEPDSSYLIPETGVYAVKMNVAGKWLDGVASIGYKPTFHQNYGEHPAIEVYLFDFADDIYGNGVSIKWYKKLRDEEKFDSAEALVRQMEQDVQSAKTYLHSPEG
jgi:riboflavin kinase/FMN adenylyltransferase